MSAILKSVGFVQVSITQKPESKSIIKKWMPGSGAEEYVCSANIIAVKPGTSKRTVEETLPLCLRIQYYCLYFSFSFFFFLARNDGGTTFCSHLRLILSIVDRGRCMY